MGTLNDEILRATGGPTVNDGLLVWYGAKPDQSVQDAELTYLLNQPTTTEGTANDLWLQFLAEFPGTINDKKLVYWTSQETPP